VLPDSVFRTESAATPAEREETGWQSVSAAGGAVEDANCAVASDDLHNAIKLRDRSVA